MSDYHDVDWWGMAQPRQFHDITPDPERRRSHLRTQIALTRDEWTMALDMGDTRRADTLADMIYRYQHELEG